MKEDKLIIIKQIELINDYINDECQEHLFYLPRSNSMVFERIRNASFTLLNNAMRILRNQKPIIKQSEGILTLEKTRELMLKMYKILLTEDFPIKKENKIRTLIKDEFNINPTDILVSNPNDDQEEKKTWQLLHHGI